MNAKVYPVLIALACICLAIVPFAIRTPEHKNAPTTQNHTLSRASDAQDLIRQLQQQDE